MVSLTEGNRKIFMNNGFTDWICRFYAKASENDHAIKPVIYCKECKHYRELEDFYNQYADNNMFLCTGLGEEGFCSLGEKNEK